MSVKLPDENFLNSRGDTHNGDNELNQKINENERITHGISPSPSPSLQGSSRSLTQLSVSNDVETLKDISKIFQNKPNLQFDKPAKYSFDNIPWIDDKVNQKLQKFEKANWKLLHVLKTVQIQLTLFEEIAKEYPAATRIPQELEKFERELQKIKNLRLYTNRDQSNSLLSHFNHISKREETTDLSEEDVELAKQVGLDVKDDITTYKQSKDKLSIDCKIRPEELKNVKSKIVMLYKEVENQFNQLATKKETFNQNYQQKAKAITASAEQVYKRAVELDPKKHQVKDNFNISTIVHQVLGEQEEEESINNEKSEQTPTRAITIATKVELPLQIQQATQFSNDLNWWNYRISKWLDAIDVIIKARINEAQSAKKIQSDQARFDKLLEHIKSHRDQIRSTYDSHVENLSKLISRSTNPPKDSLLKLYLHQKNTLEQIRQSELNRLEHLEIAQINLLCLKHQWSYLANRIDDMSKATAIFTQPPAQDWLTYYGYGWVWDYIPTKKS